MGDDTLLFSYGNLRVPQVQQDVFGRRIAGERDVLVGYTIDYLDGVDGDDAERPENPTLRATGDPHDKVVGAVLRVGDDELEASDEYENELYCRTRVVLGSGRTAWVYIAQ